MSIVETQLAEGQAALASLDEAAARVSGSVIERDSAILRLIYTFAAVSKACSHLLAERKGIEIRSASAAICSARRLGWLSDEDAEAALAVNRDRELAFEIYRPGIGDEIAERLAVHAALLRRWLDSLRERAADDGAQ